MAELFVKQAKQYADTRPSYPPELFQFIASKTPSQHLAWDVGTGSGQAAQSLAEIYNKVIATDTSEKQLEYATKLPNVLYKQTPPTMSMTEIEKKVSPQSSIDLVIIAQALHWFDHPTFYQQVKWILKKPHGVIAAWCYTIPRVNEKINTVLDRLYYIDSKPFWDPARKLVENEYRSIDFPFEPVDGADHTGPFEFVTKKVMDSDDFLRYIRSWSAYQTAKEKGVELLRNDVVEEFQSAWNEGGDGQKVVEFPIFLRIGRVGDV
ncbi:S-adenosylmethionine-dependent methyltransferase [Quillaja saponaria]|uniref:S-adenosylmethionine-dependent methyltransferase n=1 Tax=Quillaja saponaria TaxID=32244 RepID=A0AAD7PZV6_QUISA|nr:S-adenosylmethionine-dependent methyltransferase [Quillaja saponaria]KAJ7972151.1 S-adenosylmethionine-dependent methyltransferase [Quillaja saponaria]